MENKFDMAIDFIRKLGVGNVLITKKLQRKLLIGDIQLSKLIEELENKKIISKKDENTGSRIVLLESTKR